MTTQQKPQKPIPAPDAESQPFFDGAAQGKLMIRQCGTCKSYLHPSAESCTECLGDDLSWVQASGRGKLHTFGVMHQQYHPAFVEEIPYNVSLVELEEGPRIQTNIVGTPNEQLKVGMNLQVTFEDMGGVTLPKFKAAS